MTKFFDYFLSIGNAYKYRKYRSDFSIDRKGVLTAFSGFLVPRTFFASSTSTVASTAPMVISFFLSRKLFQSELLKYEPDDFHPVTKSELHETLQFARMPHVSAPAIFCYNWCRGDCVFSSTRGQPLAVHFICSSVSHVFPRLRYLFHSFPRLGKKISSRLPSVPLFCICNWLFSVCVFIAQCCCWYENGCLLFFFLIFWLATFLLDFCMEKIFWYPSSRSLKRSTLLF